MRRYLHLFFVLLVLAVSGAGTFFLVKSRKPPEKTPHEKSAPLVRAKAVTTQSRTVTVVAHGTVRPFRRTQVVPEVSGRINHVSDAFVSGGFVAKGALLFAMETVDYKAALARAASLLEQRRYERLRTESDARVAKEEWERFQNSGMAEQYQVGSPGELLLFGPQLKKARAAEAAALADLAVARKNLSRCKVQAPFDARVLTESVSVGQYVRAGEGVGTLFGTRRLEVEVPVPEDRLRWLTFPDPATGTKGSPAQIVMKGAGVTRVWTGHVDRLLGDVEEKGRMRRLVVRMTPSLAPDAGRILAPAIGMFVEVALAGKTLPRVIPVPVKGLRDGKKVWVADADDRLQIRPVTWKWATGEELWVESGLSDGDRVIIGALSGVVAGMPVRVAEASGFSDGGETGPEKAPHREGASS